MIAGAVFREKGVARPPWSYPLLNPLLLLTLIVALPNNMSGATEKYFPQAIRGDVLNTTRILVWNLGSSAATVTTQFFDQTGEQLESLISLLEGNGSEKIAWAAPP